LTTRITIIYFAVALSLSSGCRAPWAGGKNAAPARVLLTVDWVQGQTLRYAFTSNRQIMLDWEPNANANGAADKVQHLSDRVRLVMAYTPVTVDPFGTSTIRVTCESVEVRRTGRPSGRGATSDALSTAQGRSFTIQVDPRGKMVDRSQLEALITELGRAAFIKDSDPRIKMPDLIGDFIASQWFLWNAVATVPDPAAGVAVGQTWTSKLWIPTPMVMRRAREVTYRLDEVRENETERLAVISSTYRLADSTPSDWPIPYSGRFQMQGTFGLLGSYHISELDGTGLELFNLDAGRIESAEQRYTLKMSASLPPMGIRAHPHITIEQVLTTERLAP
jgi:hypothetical protein